NLPLLPITNPQLSIPLHLAPLYICTLLVSSFIDPPTLQIYPLSLHDALPISVAAANLGAQRIPQELAQSKILGGRYRRRLSQLGDRKSTRLNSSHVSISYAVFCLKKKKKDRLR